MTGSFGYKIIDSTTRKSSRVTRFYASKNGFLKTKKSHKHFDFSRLADGQALAGSGALVFEGELLDLSKR